MLQRAVIRSFSSRALKRYWMRNDPSGVRAEWLAKVKRQLSALETAKQPTDMDQLGWGFHALRGDLKGRYALTVSRNWRLTFGWDGDDAIDVDLEDYHGS